MKSSYTMSAVARPSCTTFISPRYRTDITFGDEPRVLHMTAPHSWQLIVLLAAVFSSVASPRTARAQDTMNFRAVVINAESEFSAAAALDVNADGRLDIVSGGWWYAAPNWERNRLREVERIGSRFDDYSNLPLDVDGDGDSDLISANYRSKSIYWVRNPGTANAQWDRIMIDTPGPSETGRLADIDNDGSADILPNGTNFAAWYSLDRGTDNRKEPIWRKHDLPQQLAGHGIGAGDVNSDGRLDLVSPAGWAEGPADPINDRWHWHDEFRLARDSSVPILCHDVDGDGDTDLIWGRGHNVGLYWTEQQAESSKADAELPSSQVDEVTTAALLGAGRWQTHAIDTSWSCAHAPMLADLDGDGNVEVVAGKRFQGHEGKDPGENDPLVVFSYQFNPQTRTWRQRTLSHHPLCGLDLDPKCVDIDADGDIDILAPARSGLVLLDNLRISKAGGQTTESELASYEPPLPKNIAHQDFSTMLPDDASQPKPIQTPLDMGQRRRQIQRQMELVMGPLPTSDRRVPLEVKIESVEEIDNVTRIKLSYAAEQGDRVPAWLLIPHGLSSPAPAMLCLHPTNFQLGKDQLLGLGGKVSRFYAHELAQRGMICLVPDYPGFGAYKYDFAEQGRHYASGTMKAIWNNIRGIDLLERLPCVKADAIGCIGHSLGGHNALYTAAFDVRIRAVMSSCGFNTFEDYYGGNLKGWTSDRYMPRIQSEYGSDPKRMPFDFPEVLAAIAPRPLFVNAPLRDSNFAVAGVRKCQNAIEPVYKMLGHGDAVTFVYPDAEHDFPDAVREQTYDWFEKQLGKPKRR